jgi:hypothetical protein
MVTRKTLKKRCSKCGEEKSADAFSTHARTADLLQPYCKGCMSKINRARYVAKRFARLTDEEKKQMRRQHVNMTVLGEFLRRHPCECSESHPSVLLLVLKTTGREFPILDKLKKITTESLEATLDRCVVRCANCHRRATSETARLLEKISQLRA